MVRVLLLLEDYNELLFTETILKKVGFDVESAKNHLNLVEILLGFNPEVLVVPGNGRRIILADVLQQVRKQRRQPDIFVIGANDLVAQDGGVTRILTQPLNPKELLTYLAEYGGLDADSLLDKYKRAQAEARETAQMQSAASIEAEVHKTKVGGGNTSGGTVDGEPKFPIHHGRAPSDSANTNVTGVNNASGDKSSKDLKIQLQPTTITSEQRAERFKKALAGVNVSNQSAYNKDRIKNEKKELRINERQDEQSMKLESERKEFLKTLVEATPTSSSNSKKTN